MSKLDPVVAVHKINGDIHPGTTFRPSDENELADLQRLGAVRKPNEAELHVFEKMEGAKADKQPSGEKRGRKPTAAEAAAAEAAAAEAAAAEAAAAEAAAAEAAAAEAAAAEAAAAEAAAAEAAAAEDGENQADDAGGDDAGGDDTGGDAAAAIG